MIYQKNRVFQLTVGDSNTSEGVLVESNLQVTFDISKSTNNKDRTNSASIEVINLDPDTLALLDTDYPAAVFSCGYEDTNSLQRIFSGRVTNVATRKNGADLATQLQLGAVYTEINHEVLSSLVAPGRNVKDVAEAIRQAIPGVSRGIYNGTNLNNEIIYGYPLSGTPKEMLDELSEKYELDWQIEEDTLYVHNNDRANSENFNEAYVISEDTGLIGSAYRVNPQVRKSKKNKAKKPGVQWTMLLNPDIRAGDIVLLQDTLIQGYFKIETLRHYGGFRDNSWYTDCKGISLEKVLKT